MHDFDSGEQTFNGCGVRARGVGVFRQTIHSMICPGMQYLMLARSGDQSLPCQYHDGNVTSINRMLAECLFAIWGPG